MLTRREFTIGIVATAAVLVLPVQIIDSEDRVRYRLELPGTRYWTQGDGSYRIFLKVREHHAGYELVSFEQISW